VEKEEIEIKVKHIDRELDFAPKIAVISVAGSV